MMEKDLQQLHTKSDIAPWRIKLAEWVESKNVQYFIIGVILVNAVTLGLETFPSLLEHYGVYLKAIDLLCLSVFIVEISIKLLVYRGIFWKNGWNCFDFAVVAVALVPNSGPFAIMRALRIFRVLRLLTVVPSLQKVVAAFLHALPGLGGVVAVMAIFFFTSGVLASHLFGSEFPQWFGNLNESLFTLFQIMTLESWSMGIVRPVMEVYPWAWAYFVPFIVIATFTILNLFIGIIVSTMQELNDLPNPKEDHEETIAMLEKMEADMRSLKKIIKQQGSSSASKNVS